MAEDHLDRARAHVGVVLTQTRNDECQGPVARQQAQPMGNELPFGTRLGRAVFVVLCARSVRVGRGVEFGVFAAYRPVPTRFQPRSGGGRPCGRCCVRLVSCTLLAVSDTAIDSVRGEDRDAIDRTVDVVSLPDGTVTFLLTDIEGSTIAWQRHSEAMSVAVARHDEIVAGVVASWSGVRPVVQGEGDSVVAAFSRATDAVAAALDVQRALQREAWPGGLQLRVRIGVHTGEAVPRDDGTYVGTTIIRAARIRDAANGGQTLVSASAATVAAFSLPDGAVLVDVGVHRLKNLDGPEQLWLLTHPDLRAVDGPLRTVEAFRHSLPVETTPLVGRVAELAALADELGREHLVTLTGSGGVGKTRLAARVGADLLDRFPGGVWWVDLAPLRDPQAIGSVLLAAIGANEDGSRPAVEIAKDRLSGAPAMVVFDNCEHLVADAAATIELLRSECPNLVVLATSREPLGLAGEVTWRVPSLSLPARGAVVDVDALGAFDAFTLFVDRARRARPDLRLSAAQIEAMVDICQQLDGIPLAIEFAAARCRQLAPERIAADLGQRFRLLTGGVRTALPRQQTLLASVEWSHDLLDDDERRVLRRLSVCSGSFRLGLAETLGAARRRSRRMGRSRSRRPARRQEPRAARRTHRPSRAHRSRLSAVGDRPPLRARPGRRRR